MLKHKFILTGLLMLAGLSPARAATLSGRNNKCLDVADGKLINGGRVQLWDCDGNNKNQQWQFQEGLLKSGSKCLDLADGRKSNGATVQLWDCFKGNANQAWELVGSNIRLTGTNFCLDVRNGSYANGATLQLYACDWRGAASNQGWTSNGSAPTPAPAAAASTSQDGTFYGYTVISIERFVQLHPECAPHKDAFIAAAKDQGLHPTFLAAIAETESSCRADVNQDGLFQFSDAGAWRVYGLSKNKLNAWDASFAAARFFADLLRQYNNDLNAAMRHYNGPIANGGNPNYFKEVGLWMSGGNPWG